MERWGDCFDRGYFDRGYFDRGYFDRGTATGGATTAAVGGSVNASGGVEQGGSTTPETNSGGTPHSAGTTGTGGESSSAGDANDGGSPNFEGASAREPGLALGGGHSCVRLADGRVACWRANNAGQLGDGTTTQRNTAALVEGLSDVVSVAAGVARSCAVLSNGAVKCWGMNDHGQLGDGGSENRLSPVDVTGLTDARQTAAGAWHTCALRADGTVYSLSAGADYGLLPGLLVPRYEFSISVANLVTPPSTRSYLVGPILEVFWTAFGPGTVHHQGFATRAFGFEAGVHSCSAFTYDSQGLTLLGCAEFGAGGLGMETKDPLGVTAQDKSTGFGTAGFVLDGQYRFGSVFLADLRLGGRAQLGGLSAERADGSEIFGAQLFGAYAQFGLGLQF